VSIGTSRGFNIVLSVTLFTNVVAMISCSLGCLTKLYGCISLLVMVVCKVPKLVGMMELQVEL